MGIRIAGLVLLALTATALAQEPAPAVVARHRDTVRDIQRGIERTTYVTLGTGSVLAIAPDMALLAAGIEIRLDYEPRTTMADSVGEYSAAFATARALSRATKFRATGHAADGTAAITITADDTEDLLAALPKKILRTLSAAGTASDHAAALADLERKYSMLKSETRGDLGLHGSMYVDALPRHTLATTELIKQLRATKPAAAASARKLWRTGHITIAMAGRFSTSDVEKAEKLVRDGLKGWSLTAPPALRLGSPNRTGQTVRVAKSGMPKTLVTMGQAIDAADERAALALEIACGGDGVLRDRLGAKLAPQDLRLLVTCTRTGKRIEMVLTIPHIDDPARADAIATLVTGELAKIVADGPTVAHLAQPQLVLLQGLNPLMMDRGPKPHDLVERPPLAERTAAADAILAVRRADVAAALKAHVDPKAFTIVIGTP